ncbi:hypothetical protein [uncultured Shewanella sp.]|uniref:Rz1-like lysis system protein LysC n=1 Tax=uncultured Shewanella sp. TaxID=173975 RepID=UPI002627798E|nr:hypothetical protein [uncultured Shewanella sp.]
MRFETLKVDEHIEQTASLKMWPTSSAEAPMTSPSITAPIRKQVISRQTNADLIQYTMKLIASLTRCNADWQRIDSWYLMKKMAQEKRKEWGGNE